MTDVGTNQNGTPGQTPATNGQNFEAVLAKAPEPAEDKYISRAFGLKQLPYPTYDAETGRILALAKPLTLSTTLSHERMMGRAFRDMVSPSMLPYFVDAIEKRMVNSPRTSQMLLGPAGLGKSYLPFMISKMRYELPPFMASCGGRSLSEVLFETIISSGTSVGIDTIEGKLIQGWRAGREVILDEYNKAKPGSDAQLQLVWQLINGELQELEITGGAGKSFIFRRKEMKPGFFVTATGNYVEDGISTSELASSAYSRLQPKFLAAATPGDWQHRFCQILTGLPISTLYAMNQPYWDKNEEAFEMVLKNLRTLGLTKDEIAFIPGWQWSFITNWKNVVAASEKISAFYYYWFEVLNAKSKFVSSSQASNIPAAVMSELNELYVRRVGLDMRKMIKHIYEALEITPHAIDLSTDARFKIDRDFAGEPAYFPDAREAIETFFGSRLMLAIVNDVEMSTMPFNKPNIAQTLVKKEQELGLIAPSGQANRNFVEVSTLLNCQAVNGINITPETTAIQGDLCGYLRDLHPQLPDDNNAILPAALVASSVKLVDQAILDSTPGKQNIALPDLDFFDKTTDRESFFKVGALVDLHAGTEALKQTPHKTPADYASIEQVLLCMALPRLGEKFVKSLWSVALSEVLGVKNNPAVLLAENNSPTNLGVTVLVCNDDGKYKNVYVMNDKADNESLILAGKAIDPSLAKLLEAKNIQYVDTSGSDQQVEAALKKFLGKNFASLSPQLVSALSLRVKTRQDDRLVDAVRSTQATKPVLALNSRIQL